MDPSEDALVQDEVVTPTPGAEPLDKSKPPEWVVNLIKWAAEDPWGFVSTLFLYLSPLLLISAFLSWKLASMIDAKEKEKKKSKTKSKNMRKVRAKSD